MLGRAYEYLIEKFADDAGKKGGEFYTPRMVVQLIVELLEPKEGMRICDPTCGSGGMLIECAHYLERHGQNPKNLSLFGQEKNLPDNRARSCRPAPPRGSEASGTSDSPGRFPTSRSRSG